MFGAVRRLSVAGAVFLSSAIAYAQDSSTLNLAQIDRYEKSLRPAAAGNRPAHSILSLLSTDVGERRANAGVRPGGPAARRKSTPKRTDEDSGHPMSDSKEHGIYTWSIFGFTEGSDTDAPDGKTFYNQSDAHVSRAAARFWGLESNLGVSYSPDERLNVFAGGSAGDELNVSDLPGPIGDGGSSTNFGVSGGWKYQLFGRSNYGYGLAVQVAPYFTRTAPVSTAATRALGVEFRLLGDTEIIPQTLFGAVNVAFAPEVSNDVVAHTSSFEISGAVAAQVIDSVFLGTEVRYAMKYDGLIADQQVGRAVFAGPTIFVSIGDKGYVGLAWSAQLAGKAANQPSADLDLQNYERNQIRAKAGFYF